MSVKEVLLHQLVVGDRSNLAKRMWFTVDMFDLASLDSYIRDICRQEWSL